MTEKKDFFNLNLASLSKTNFKLYTQLIKHKETLNAMRSNRYTFIQSRTGETVPVMLEQSLHSAVDPKREAQRLISTFTLTAGLEEAKLPVQTESAERKSKTGFLIFLGLGGGFFPEEALELTDSIVTVIDFDIAGIAELFSSKDYTHLIENDRFNILADPSSEEIKNFILENYKPSLYGGIKTIPLRTRIENDKFLFDSLIKDIQEAIDIVSGDYSVQAHFGKRWFSNIIRQLANNENLTINHKILFNKKEANPVCANSVCANKVCAIVAAGPSLDIQIKTIAEIKNNGGIVISTDTAFPVLAHNDIEPDFIVSIDCQHISFLHFLSNKPQKIPLILDIASPPALSQLAENPVFFASGHPLARYIARKMNLPLLDTSGANVTYACLSLAEYLGAERITLFAADFSYVNSQSYARETYIYPYFYKRQNRFSTIEAQFSKFLYRSPFVNSGINGKNKYFETSSLRFYRLKMEEKISSIQADVSGAQGTGALISFNKKQKTENEERGLDVKEKRKVTERQIESGLEFLKHYQNEIAALPCAEGKENYFKKLNNEQLQIFTTLLPYAAFIRKQNPGLGINDIIEEVKKRSVSEIEKIIF